MKKMEDMSKEGGEEEGRGKKKRKRSKRGRKENTRMNLVMGRLGKGGGESHQ